MAIPSPAHELPSEKECAIDPAMILDLPQELRDDIYRQLVIADGWIIDLPIRRSPRLAGIPWDQDRTLFIGFDNPRERQARKHFKVLSRVCKQMQEEVKLVFYRENIFSAAVGTQMLLPLRQHLELIRHVLVNGFATSRRTRTQSYKSECYLRLELSPYGEIRTKVNANDVFTEYGGIYRTLRDRYPGWQDGRRNEIRELVEERADPAVEVFRKSFREEKVLSDEMLDELSLSLHYAW